MPAHVNGRRVTFTAPTNASAIIGDFTDDADRPIPLSAGQSVTFEFGLGAHIEYAFLDGQGQRMADPDNASGANHPWYKEYRSVSLAGYAPPLEPDVTAPQGRSVAAMTALARQILAENTATAASAAQTKNPAF